MTTLARIFRISILSLAALLPDVVSAATTTSVQTSAKCIDDGVVKASQIRSNAPSGCTYLVDRPGFNRRAGDSRGFANGFVVANTAGVAAFSNSVLEDTALPTVFGAETRAFSRVSGYFRPNGTAANGARVGSGYMTINFSATGSLLLAGQGDDFVTSNGYLRYSVDIDNQVREEREYDVFAISDSQTIGTLHEATGIHWDGNSLMQFGMQAEAYSYAILENVGKVDVEIAFFNTLRWLGISNVTDELGRPVASFTAISDDGTFDWATASPVPQPPTSWLFASGALALLFRCCRRRVGPLKSPELELSGGVICR